LRVLVIGNGAREHALAWKLKQSPKVKEVYCAPGNGGMGRVGTCVPIDASNIVELADFAEKLSIGLTVVGPELALILGVVDEFEKRGLPIFGASRAAAEIEGSKAFSKRFMETHAIPTARYSVCSSITEAEAKVKSGEFGYPVVLKADGLAGGKGVIIAADEKEAHEGITRIMGERAFGNAGDRLVIEEFLVGEEVSFMVLADGKRILPLASAQDYKRVYDADQGPNTGGMGSFSPSRLLNAESSRLIFEGVVQPTLKGLADDGRRFTGVLYVGIMLTTQGPKVLEFNARLGDPETQSIIARLDTDLAELLLAAVGGRLDQVKISWRKEVSLSVVLASPGYPVAVKTGQLIEGLEEAEKVEGVTIFHAGTALRDGKLYTSGGRVLTVTATAPSLAAARDQAYRAASLIRYEGMHYRKDIGAAYEAGPSA